MAFNKLDLIEFTKDTATRKAGTRLKVDKDSAVSFCDKLKVAKRVSADDPTPAPVTPVTVVAVDVEPEDTPPADVDTEY